MNTETLVLLIAVIILVLAAGIGAWFFYRKKSSEKLRRRFGREYDRTVNEYGEQSEAEAELKAREKRVEKLRLVPLPPQEAAQFTDAWRSVQALFVDSPKDAVKRADILLREVMLKRGYPMTDFERRAADLSVHYPHLIDNYRRAREIASQNERGAVDTEQLRQALVYYRALFDELLETAESEKKEEKTKRAEVGI
jgi:hypothetical protein